MADAVNDSDTPPPTKKCAVCQKAVEKWIKENDRSLNTTDWLKFDSDRHDHVNTISCYQFKDILNCLECVTTILRSWRGQVMSEPLLSKNGIFFGIAHGVQL